MYIFKVAAGEIQERTVYLVEKFGDECIWIYDISSESTGILRNLQNGKQKLGKTLSVWHCYKLMHDTYRFGEMIRNYFNFITVWRYFRSLTNNLKQQNFEIFRHLKKYLKNLKKQCCHNLKRLGRREHWMTQQLPLLPYPGDLKYKTRPMNYRKCLHCTGSVCCPLLEMTLFEIPRENGRHLFET